jgi:hypothetical protein
MYFNTKNILENNHNPLKQFHTLRMDLFSQKFMDYDRTLHLQPLNLNN